MKKKGDSKPFERKSHNQKIHDAHIQRKQEKEVAKKVIVYFVVLFLFHTGLVLLKAKEEHKQAVNAAMVRYKTNKQQRSKKLVKKTRRGQPVMGEQIELLLNKIQKQKEKQ